MHRTSDLKLVSPKQSLARHTGELPPELPDRQIHARRRLPLIPDKFVRRIEPEPPETEFAK